MDNTKAILSHLGQVCNETTGGSFTISRNKQGNWKVNLVNMGATFTNEDIDKAAEEAIDWIKDKRQPIEREVKYTLFTK